MKMPIKQILLLTILTVATQMNLKSAEQPTASELKMRETLRATLLQLRDVQGQLAAIQAAKAESDKALLESKTQLDELTKKSAQEREEAEKEKTKLAVKIVVLQRTVADRETKNLALYKLGNEILQRYEKFGLGDALTAKEPFVGVSRVKLETLVQDYQDKMLEQRVSTSK